MTKLTLATAIMAATTVMATVPSQSPHYIHPLIKDHGGIVSLPKAAEQPGKDSKVVLDITSDKTVGDVIKGLDRAALIANQYTDAEVGPRQGMKIVIILHGPATKAVLSDRDYVAMSSSYARQHGLSGNPNLPLIRQLAEAGVEVLVCGQALAHHGFATEQVAEPVQVAVSAATVNINRQMAGYAYVPFH